MTVFSTGSYSGATTAEIARVAGISEPILYRHFGSKRELYFACLDEAWRRLRQVFAEKLQQGERVAGSRRDGAAPPSGGARPATEPLDPGSDRGGRGPRDRAVPAPAHARRARLHGRRRFVRRRSRASSPPTAIRTRRRGSSSAAASSSRSPIASAACSTTRTSPRSPPNASAGSPAPAEPVRHDRFVINRSIPARHRTKRASACEGAPNPTHAASGVLARHGSARADPLRPKRTWNVPGCGSGDDPGEASCHESDAPRLVILRLDHAPAVAAVAF